MIKLLKIFLFFIFISTSSFAAGQENFIVAKINNKAITYFEVLNRYKLVILLSKIKISSSEEKEILFKQVIDKMVEEELVRQEASNLKISIDDEEIKNALEIMALQSKKNPQQFKAFLVNNGVIFENYLKQIESEVLWSKIISENLRPRVKVSESEVAELFEQKKIDVKNEKFFLAEILISSKNDGKKFAEKITLELRNGADFKSIVKQFSQSLNSENNGEIGWVSKQDIDKRVFDEISKFGKNGYSNPILLNDGYHIFKIIDIKYEKSFPEQDYKEAKAIIFNQKLQTLAKGYLIDLRKKSFIEIKS